MNTALLVVGSFTFGVMVGIALICFLQNSCSNDKVLTENDK